MVTWFEAAVLGVVQGLTEFLPISSNAHVRIVSTFFGWPDPGAAFTAVMQLGTETAVLVYFWRDIWRIVSTWARSLVQPAYRGDFDARMGWYVILGSIPIGVLGLAFQHPIENQLRTLVLVAVVLVLFSFVLAAADMTARDARPLTDLTVRDTVLFGLAQSLALIPGVSRSGGTISAGLLMGYTREAAARYSFLLAVPAVFASGLFELKRIGPGDAAPAGPTALAAVIAFVVGLGVIAWFLRFISHHTFRGFVIYRILAGLVVLGLIAGHVISNTG